MRVKILFPLMLLLIMNCCFTQAFSQTQQTKPVTMESIMQEIQAGRQYIAVFFWKGDVAPDTAHAAEMQAAHLQFLFGQRNMGKIAIFGPFMDAGDLGGLAIFNATNEDEVKKIMARNPI